MYHLIWALVISLLASVFVRLLFYLPRPYNRLAVRQRLNRLTGNVAKRSDPIETRSTLSRLARPARIFIEQKPINHLLHILLNSKKSAKYERHLLAADLYRQLSLSEYFGVKLLLAIALPAAFISFVLGNGVFGLIILVGTIYAGYRLPDFFLFSLAEERQAKIKRSLADAIDLLIVGMEAGLGFDRALRLYCERFKGPLSEEFKKTLAEIDIGQTRRRALSDLAKRVQLEDLNLFVSAILQAEKLGTPLVPVLVVQSETARTRHRQWVQELSAKAPIKMLFPLAGLILPALFAVLLGPVVLKMLADS